MEVNYPRYPVDFYRLYLIFGRPDSSRDEPPTVIFDAVRENPFGTAFQKTDGTRTNVRTL